METTRFSTLSLRDWKQFKSVHLEFHPRCTVLTGANGSGKTTIINLLARHFGWGIFELATPAEDLETGRFRFYPRFPMRVEQVSDRDIGELIYANGIASSLTIPNKDSPKYHVSISSPQTVSGFSVPSHRSTYLYQEIEQIVTARRTKEQAFTLASDSIRGYFTGGNDRRSNFHIKQTLLSWALGGSGNEFIQADNELRGYFIDFQSVLRTVLPESLGFREIEIRNFEVVLITNSGEFMLDAVSGGISSIVDLAWQMFTLAKDKDAVFTVLIDEVEVHLHPAMQRSILPSFLSAFPNAQFIVATHSPLIVGSVEDSNVYVLRQAAGDNHRRFSSERLDLTNKAKSATDVLNEVLGVPFTMPIWVEDKLNSIVQKYLEQGLNPHTFVHLRSELKEIGLEDLVPAAIQKTLKNND